MSWLKVFATVGVSAALVTTTMAADMPDYPPLPFPPLERSQRQVELLSGWYLRGDIGYRFHGTGSSSSGDPTLVPTPNSATLDNTFMGGLGAGFKADWFRADLTGDYGWRSKYSATGAAGTTIAGKIESFTVMGNGYVDLGTWYSITPYVGVGLGAANLIFSGYENSAAVSPMPSTAVPIQRWNFAWAAMAGVSYSISKNFLVDVGYRHVDMGDVNGGPGGQLTVKHLTGDEIRVGLRYLID